LVSVSRGWFRKTVRPRNQYSWVRGAKSLGSTKIRGRAPSVQTKEAYGESSASDEAFFDRIDRI
jgi:hypothetical protein